MEAGKGFRQGINYSKNSCCKSVLLREGVNKRMSAVLGQDSALQGYTGPGTNWANEMNFGMNHASGAGSVASVDLQSCTPSLCYGCPWDYSGLRIN